MQMLANLDFDVARSLLDAHRRRARPPKTVVCDLNIKDQNNTLAKK